MTTQQSEAVASASARLTRTRYAQVPIDVLEKYGDKKGTIVVYCWLWHYAGRDDQAFPSVDRLAAECRMKPDDVRVCLKSLTGDGWISRVDRPGQTTLFHVRSERVHPSPKRGTPPPKRGTPKQGSTPLPQKGEPTPPPKGGPNKNHLTKTNYQEDLEPPFIPPAGGRRDERGGTHPYLDQVEIFGMDSQGSEQAQAQPQPQQPVKPWEPSPPSPPAPDPEPQPEPLAEAPVKARARKPKLVFEPTEQDIPARLLPVASELLEFWPTRSGQRTQRAWAAQLGELIKIQQDPAGGTEAIRSQLQAGIQAAIFGKAWMAVTHANWQRFGRATTPIMGTGFRQKQTTMERVMGAALLIEEAEARRKARTEQPQAQNELVLVEVA